MSDRSLRGMRLGAQSMETEAGVEPAARQQIEYRSKDGESVVVTFAAEADVPNAWPTKSGKEALRVDGKGPVADDTKPQRTHWDMLLERRSIEELDETLAGQLEKLRARRGEGVDA